MKVRNVSVSLYDDGKGEIKVWCANFSLKGSLPRKNGKVDPATLNKLQKTIAGMIGFMDIPGDNHGIDRAAEDAESGGTRSVGGEYVAERSSGDGTPG